LATWSITWANSGSVFQFQVKWSGVLHEAFDVTPAIGLHCASNGNKCKPGFIGIDPATSPFRRINRCRVPGFVINKPGDLLFFSFRTWFCTCQEKQ